MAQEDNGVKPLEDRLGDKVVDLAEFFKHRLIDGLIRIFCSHLIDEAVEGYHGQQILFIVNPKLLPVRFDFFIDEFPGYPYPLFIREFNFIGIRGLLS